MSETFGEQMRRIIIDNPNDSVSELWRRVYREMNSPVNDDLHEFFVYAFLEHYPESWKLQFEVNGLETPLSKIFPKVKPRMQSRLERFILKHLNKQLDSGRHEFVYRFSNYWGDKSILFGEMLNPLFFASEEVQDRLIREFGYCECPSCNWAARGAEHSCPEQARVRSEIE